MKNILVTINFDLEAEVLINKASELAEKFNSKIWIVHIAAPDPDFMGYTEDLQYIRDFRDDELKKEHIILKQFSDKLKAKGIEAEGLLIQGQTEEMIVEESKKLMADLIIMGHHEHGLLYRLFLGSPYPGVVNKSKIPVLIIPLGQAE